ncbi:MAG: glycosyltransferase [Candidatus Omnitrophica bacterium]|nr:glycosyltransferase [Candidatus Omnitrophota bacterium]
MDTKNTRRHTIYYFSAIGLFTLVSCFLIFGMIDISESNVFLAIFWMFGFAVLTLNVGYVLVSAIAALLTKNMPSLKEKRLRHLPKTAVVYVVRNEHEVVIKENMAESFANNRERNVDIWLLSNSDIDECVVAEKRAIAGLQKRFGKRRVRYFQTRNNSLRRKHVCIHQWLGAYPEYRYFAVCDADSILPHGTLRRLVSKAEHPANKSIALFQSHISIIKRATYFSSFLSFGQDICQGIYSRANQNVFGRGVSYGSGCLIRCKAFRKIEVPDWVLSHDIWDTVSLEEKGYRVVFCSDVVTYGRYPSNYIEYLKRTRRWIAGTLESMPRCLRSKVSPGTRFMVLYPAYMYAIQPLFLIWIFSGFFYNNKVLVPMLVTQKYAFLGGSFVDLEMGSHLFFTMAIISGHRFIKCRNLKEAKHIIVEFLTTMLLCLNSIIFDSASVIKWLIFRKKGMGWVPMKKGPYQKMAIKDVAKELWPVALIGVVSLILGIIYNPLWTLFASPFICSFILGIPVAYLTGHVTTIE